MRLLSIMLILLGLTLSACGNKGPLYLPDDNKTPEKANKAAIPTEGFETSIASYFEANSAKDGRGMGQGRPFERKNSFQCFFSGTTANKG